jgi:hypothetical protein
MGVDCTGYQGDHFSFSWGGWERVLRAAFENGWEPEGTYFIDWSNLPESDVQEFPNGVIYVSTPDTAKAWHEPWTLEEPSVDGYFTNDLQVVSGRDATNLANALEKVTWSEEDLAGVRAFVSLCRAGAFRIS